MLPAAVAYLALRVYGASRGWDTLPSALLSVGDGSVSYHIESYGRKFDVVEGSGYGAQTSFFAEVQNLRRELPMFDKQISDIEGYLSHIEDTRKELDRLKGVTPMSKERIAALEQGLLDSDKDEQANRDRLAVVRERKEAVEARIAELLSYADKPLRRWSFDLDSFVVPGVTE